MSVSRIEVAIGDVNGVNVSFRTSVPYQAGTLRVFLNGLLLVEGYEDGWTPISPDAGTFEMKEAPLTGDIVQAFYTDATATIGTEAEVTRIVGRIAQVGGLEGAIRPIQGFTGTLDTVSSIAGRAIDVESIKGTVQEISSVSGILREV